MHWPKDYKGPYNKGDTKEGSEGIVFNGEVGGYGFEYKHPIYYPLYIKELSKRFKEELERNYKSCLLT